MKKKQKQITKDQQRMIDAVKHLQNYIVTYDQQCGYEKYSDECYIDDILYGLGISLDKKYEYADGFDAFKNVLRKHLEDNK